MTLIEKLLQIALEKASLKEVLETNRPFIEYHEVVSEIISERDDEISSLLDELTGYSDWYSPEDYESNYLAGVDAGRAEYDGYYSPEEYDLGLSGAESSIRAEYEGYYSPTDVDNIREEEYNSGYSNGADSITLTTKLITSNGSYSPETADGYSSVTVNVLPRLTTKTITADGTYSPYDDIVDLDNDVPEYQGYSSVTVETGVIQYMLKDLLGKLPLFLNSTIDISEFINNPEDGLILDPSIGSNNKVFAIYDLDEDAKILKRSLPCIPLYLIAYFITTTEYDSSLTSSNSPAFYFVVNNSMRQLIIKNDLLNFTNEMTESFINGLSESSFNNSMSDKLVAYLKLIFAGDENSLSLLTQMLSYGTELYTDFLIDVKLSQKLYNLELNGTAMEKFVAKAFDPGLNYVAFAPSEEELARLGLTTGDADYIILAHIGGSCVTGVSEYYAGAFVTADRTAFLLHVDDVQLQGSILILFKQLFSNHITDFDD